MVDNQTTMVETLFTDSRYQKRIYAHKSYLEYTNINITFLSMFPWNDNYAMYVHSAMRDIKTVTAHLKSKQLLTLASDNSTFVFGMILLYCV